jgi:tRNA A-37 threonylcarbamoyl transferase component Bud32
MAKCRFCGTANPAGSSYCSHCGGAFAVAPAGRASRAAPAAAPKQPAASGAQPAAKASPSAAAQTATPAPAPHAATGSLPPQTRLNGRYFVLATVGQGGMAAVYRALDSRTKKQVAIKEMSQDGLSPQEEAEALAAFRAEADMLQRLRHPNLPRVFERFSEGTRHYLVMEYVEGQTLEQRQQASGGGPLPEQDVMAWAAQLCSVFTYLHTQRPPIIFRDLKPANVMVTPQGQVKLIDFGIARVFHPGRTKDTQVLGTPGFAPPEQYGKSQTDARADVYALGVTLYQLLTGYDPASTPFTLPPAHTRNPRLSPHIQAALEHATRLDRDARYATIADLGRDLLRPEGFVFRTGQRARNVPELVALCRANPQEAQEHLYTRRFEGWLIAIGQPQTAWIAGNIVAAGGDRGAGLAAFMDQATRPVRLSAGPPPLNKQATQAKQPTATGSVRSTAGPNPGVGAGARTGTAGAASTAAASPVAAGAARLAGRVASQMASRVASYTAQRFFAQATAAAATVVGTQILIEVRPRSVNFGALMAGQRGTMAVTVGGQNGLPVVGRIVSLAPWLHVDRADFVGPSTLVQLSLDTVQLPKPGPYQTNLQITSGTQQLYVPVTVEVLSTRTPKPKAGPPPARPQRVAKPASAKHQPAAAEPEWVRVIKSWLAALGMSAFAALELEHATTAYALTLPTWLPLIWVLLAGMIMAAAPAAVIGRWGADQFPRLVTAWLTATVGAAAALVAAQFWLLRPGGPLSAVASGQGAVWLTLLGALGISAGAAFGATPQQSKRIVRVLRFATQRTAALLVMAAMAVGGWVGFALTQPIYYGLIAPCGAVVGILLAAVLATRAGRFLNRAFGHP